MSRTWLYDAAICFHLLGAFSLVSGIVVAGVGFEMARRRTSCAEVALLLGLARIGAVVVAAGTIVTAGFGLWLVNLGHWGYGTGWVDAAIGLLAVVIVIGSIGGQRPKRARKLATRLAAEGVPPSPELRSMLNDRMAIALNYLSAAALVAIIVLMVVKPGSPHH
ncbi:MAG: DUF2269 family protein [Acidimicrobiales bacterium]